MRVHSHFLQPVQRLISHLGSSFILSCKVCGFYPQTPHWLAWVLGLCTPHPHTRQQETDWGRGGQKRDTPPRGVGSPEGAFQKVPHNISASSHWPEPNHTAAPCDKESGKCLARSEACQTIRVQLLRGKREGGQLASPTHHYRRTSKILRVQFQTTTIPWVSQ